MKKLKIRNRYLILACVVITLIICTAFFLNRENTCSQRVGSSFSADLIVDKCYGIIVVEVAPNDVYKYSLYDYTHNYRIGVTKASSSIIAMKDYVYFIDTSEFNHVTFSDGSSSYVRRYYDGNAIIKYDYSSVDEIPRYIKVSSINGQVTPYVKLDGMPENDRSIFEGLINKHQ